MTRRRIHRSDLNQSALVKLARQLGMQVELTGRPVDAFVAISGVFYAVEIKSAQGTYTPAQEAFRARCEASGAPMLTWRDQNDVLACHGWGREG